MKKISRRDFLKVTGLVGAAAALTACGGSASSTAASTASSAAGSAAASTAALGADTQAIVDRGVLKVGVKNAVQGFSFQDTLTGEYKGLEDSLAEMIAEHLGVDVEFTTVTAATRGELLDSGDIDAVLATFTITEERKKTWDFSTPYYTDYVSVLVEDSTGIKGLADLKDKVVGVSSGSTSARALVKAMIDEGVLDGANFDADTFNADTWKDGVSFRQYDDYPAISTALSAGEVQGFCVDKSILAIYKTEGRSYIDAEFSPQEYGVATKKGSDFSTLCDDLVKGWLADGTIEQLIKDNGLDQAQTFQNQESAGKGEFAMSGLFSLESWSTVWTHRESFLLGLGNTLQTAVCALALAFIIGAALGLMSRAAAVSCCASSPAFTSSSSRTPRCCCSCASCPYALALRRREPRRHPHRHHCTGRLHRRLHGRGRPRRHRVCAEGPVRGCTGAGLQLSAADGLHHPAPEHPRDAPSDGQPGGQPLQEHLLPLHRGRR